MSRRVAVPALFVAVAAGVGYALVRLRRRGADTSFAPRPVGDGTGPESEYVCDCGQAFRVTGAGRHRVYWLPDAAPADPVVSAECPSCGRPLPHDPTVTGAAA
jgi:hypothetical protein